MPALQGGFIWDDDAHVTAPALQSLAGLRRIWTEPGATQQYYPVLHSVFWIEHRMLGDAPLGYHLINLGWHLLAVGLFVCLLTGLWKGFTPGTIPGGVWVAGGLFALHPVCVESVAWVSEQKNTLSTVLYLGAALLFMRWSARGGRWRYAVATFLFVLGLLTKSVTATLPAALLVIAWFRQGRISRRDVGALLPWFAVAVGMGLFTAWMEQVVLGASGADFDLSAVDRVLLAGRAAWFYFAKLLWPADLIFIYPRWQVSSAQLWQYAFPLGLVLFFGWLIRLSRKGGTAPLAAALLFVGTLFPALGFVNVYPFLFSFVADHFQYLASLAVFGLAGAGWQLWRRRRPTLVPGMAALALMLLLASLTWNQCVKYASAESLYRSVLAANPDCWMADYNLGVLLQRQGQGREAEACYRRAASLRPEFPQALNNLGVILIDTGRPSEAVDVLRSAVAAYRGRRRLPVEAADADANLGRALQQVGNDEEAAVHFEKALEVEEDREDLRNNYAVALIRSGRPDAAQLQLELALKRHPDDGVARENLERLRGLLLSYRAGAHAP